MQDNIQASAKNYSKLKLTELTEFNCMEINSIADVYVPQMFMSSINK